MTTPTSSITLTSARIVAWLIELKAFPSTVGLVVLPADTEDRNGSRP
jgi:hypothetical protein